MAEFGSILLAPIAKKLQAATREMQHLVEFASTDPFSDGSPVSPWAATTTISAGIHNVYNGLEDIMKAICANVDGHVPEGGASHQEILDQLATRTKSRGPLLDDALLADLTALKGFRHVVNHRYGIELDRGKMMENMERLTRVFPRVLEAIAQLDAHLAPEDEGPAIDDPFG